MSYSNPLILQVHLAGAEPYELGDEIWQQSLSDAIRAEAEIIADHAGPDLLPVPSRAARVALRDRIVARDDGCPPEDRRHLHRARQRRLHAHRPGAA